MNERPINNGRGLLTESHPALIKMSGANGGIKRQLEARDQDFEIHGSTGAPLPEKRSQTAEKK